MIEVTLDGKKVVTAHIGRYSLKTDQPVDYGGEETAPTPFDLFLASIGTCAGIYVKSFCDKRNISAENIKIIQTVDYNNETGLPAFIKIDIQLPPDFPEKYRASVISAAELCKVKKTIAAPPVFEVITSIN